METFSREQLVDYFNDCMTAVSKTTEPGDVEDAFLRASLAQHKTEAASGSPHVYGRLMVMTIENWIKDRDNEAQ